MIRDFDNMAVELAQQIAAEEERTKIKDPGHVAYSMFAKATASRRHNLLTSVADLKSKRNAAKRGLDDVTMQLQDPELAQHDGRVDSAAAA